MENNVLWSKILDKMKFELNSLAYQTWFENTKLYDLSNGIATIIVPFALHKSHLNNNYIKLLNTLFIEEIGESVEFEFLIEEEIPTINNTDENIPLDDDKNDDDDDEYFNSNLKSEYTFESFVVGDSNKFAHAGALAIAENPGKLYNPFFLYGNSGLGKTHLMHAIGNYIEKNTSKRVLYVSSETFKSDFIQINKKENNKSNFDNIDFFKKKYRKVDILIIDDIQFLAGAPESQKEFFFTFEKLYGDKKQIIISSDRSPNDLKIFEDRLRTRFGWGLTVNIYPPDFELKKAILRKKILGEKINREIPEQVLEYMASSLGTNIRQLEGGLIRLIAYSTMMGKEIDLDLAIEALKDEINKGFSERNDVSRIQKVVSDHFKISIDDLKSKKRSSSISFPRQIAMYLCRSLTDESFPRIGMEFGGRDHSTVIHACDKIEEKIKFDKNLREEIDKMKKDIIN